jgi:hypothetical protein
MDVNIIEGKKSTVELYASSIFFFHVHWISYCIVLQLFPALFATYIFFLFLIYMCSLVYFFHHYLPRYKTSYFPLYYSFFCALLLLLRYFVISVFTSSSPQKLFWKEGFIFHFQVNLGFPLQLFLLASTFIALIVRM